MDSMNPGGPGGLDMNAILGRVQEMQQKMAESQDALSGQTVTAEAGGGMVTVTATGGARIKSIKLDADGLHLSQAGLGAEDLEMLEDLLIAGINKALDEVDELRASEMRKSASSMLPPGMDLGGMGL